jgi:copper chaperone
MQETFNVPDISCEHCKHAIEGALAPLAGVESASVDVDARTVAVSYDESTTDRAALVGALEEEGYPAAT